jgi:acetyl-CoA carboxylase biotin carboxyl carrier protein
MLRWSALAQGQPYCCGETSNVAEHKKAQAQDEPSAFARFVRKTVGPLSRAFADSPLMQLRVRTPHGSVTLAKAAPIDSRVSSSASAEMAEAPKSGHPRVPLARVYNGEAGRTYDTINAEVVGIFRDIPEPPTTGDHLEAGRLLGHIEALRLRNEVRCPIACKLIAQVVVDGQPVDFGEPLFVVDSGGAPLPQVEAQTPSAPQTVEIIEPPRL